MFQEHSETFSLCPVTKFFILTNFSTLKPETHVKKAKADQKTNEQRAAEKKARQAVCII